MAGLARVAAIGCLLRCDVPLPVLSVSGAAPAAASASASAASAAIMPGPALTGPRDLIHLPFVARVLAVAAGECRQDAANWSSFRNELQVMVAHSAPPVSITLRT